MEKCPWCLNPNTLELKAETKMYKWYKCCFCECKLQYQDNMLIAHEKGIKTRKHEDSHLSTVRRKAS